ncbi:hypothetical protein V8E36_001879 [Tilletia maclaganii]
MHAHRARPSSFSLFDLPLYFCSLVTGEWPSVRSTPPSPSLTSFQHRHTSASHLQTRRCCSFSTPPRRATTRPSSTSTIPNVSSIDHGPGPQVGRAHRTAAQGVYPV